MTDVIVIVDPAPSVVVEVATVGVQGPPGVGSRWWEQSGVPSSSTGSDGDLSLNTATGDVYQKQTGNWVLVGNIKGPDGFTGQTIDGGNF